MDGRKRILVVDDESGVRDSLRLLLKSNFDVSVAEDGKQALELFEAETPDLVLLDLMMPQLDGVQTLRQMKDRNGKVPVIMLSGANTVKSAVEAMKCGAVDYLNKPFDIEELTTLIVSTLGNELSQEEAIAPTQRHRLPAVEADFGPMVGQASSMNEVFTKVRQVAERDTTVLVTGESGTGKELIARRIHDLSARKNGPFVAINCAAIPESLIESELFGHEKGAFTHAVERRIGHFELADGGTLFLDEIGELSLGVQVKMLRFLQEQEFYRVGRSKPIRVNVRVIAATNKHLEDLIAQKLFRQDLFYRINVINIQIPPLRDRFEDIPKLCDYFVKKFSPLYADKQVEFETDALDALVQYDWPGNVRELENAVESLLALVPHAKITIDDLPRRIRERLGSGGAGRSVAGENLRFDDAERMFESEMILKALRKTNYVQTRAAQLLGISRRILKYKMDKLGIKESEEKLGSADDESKAGSDPAV